MIRKSFSLIFTCCLILSLFSCSFEPKKESLSIDILDIGKADCILIQTNEQNIMIDCGEQENAAKILSFLKNNSVAKIDYLILSHFDKDHIGGVNDIINKIQVENIIESTFSSDREEYDLYHETIKKKNISLLQIKEDYKITLEEAEININTPEKDHYDRKQDNNASLLVHLNTNGKNFLFCGDAMEERLEEFIAKNKTTYDFVKLPYHGNWLDNYPAFIESVKPSYTALTCSKKNPPDSEVITLLKNKKIPNYQSDYGNIKIKLIENKINIYQ